MPVTKLPTNSLVEAIRGTAQRMQQPTDDNVLKAQLLGFLGKILENQLPTEAEQILPMPVAMAVTPRIPNPIEAYHASPHEFTAFDASKIGEGIGQQEYGHGLYFSAAKRAADNLRQKFVQLGRTPKGHVYEVNIHANPEDFLDWDKPLSQQSEKVRQAWLRTKEKLPPNATDDLGANFSLLYGNEIRPQEFLNTVASLGDPNLGEKALKQAGIPGIKYLDQGSRTTGKDTYNYVVFDDKLIEIVKRYGIAAAIGAGLINEGQARQLQAQGYE